MPGRRKLGNETITIIRAPMVVNPRGNNDERDWSNPTQTVVSGCSVQSTKLSDKLRYENENEREHQTTFYRVYVPAGTDVEYTDMISYDGDLFEVQGDPSTWRQFSGKAHHIAFLMKIREG